VTARGSGADPGLSPAAAARTRPVAATAQVLESASTRRAAADTPRARARRFAVETPLGRTRRARRINRVLAETYPDARTDLDFTTPLELLVATVLSAQCTDARVNLVTPALFARYRDAADYARADRCELEALIVSTGFFRAKAAALTGLGAALVDRHGGAVPADLDALVALPGVGRKTANVVLGDAFAIPGLTIDTHVGRLVRRWGWTTAEDPVRVETEVATLLPRAEWTSFSHRAIWHGRRCCTARKPACERCPLVGDCPSAVL